MVEVNVAYPDFSAGEISPELYGRFDLAVFYKGARRVENFITQATGMARFRTGTIYAATTRDNQKAVLASFTIDEATSFVLELTNLKMRFYRTGGRIHATGQDITAVTQANPAVVTYDGSDTYANGDRVWIDGVVGMTELNRREFTVANVDTGANTFELSGINSSAFGAYVSGGTIEEIIEVTTPFAEADLFDLQFAQAGVDMYIAHPSYNPQKLTFTSATSWNIGNHSPTGLTLTANNRPAAVGFYEQRLVYAGSNNAPNTLYFSKSADPNDFTTGTGATDGIAYTIAGGTNKIRWLRGTPSFLAIGAFSDVVQATGGIDDVITVDSISIKPTNSFGTAKVNPIGKGTQIFFVQANNIILRSFEYDLESDAYVPVNRNTVAEHITRQGITQIEYQDGNPNIVWATRTDGVLCGMTFEEAESVSGWHKHTTDGKFISIAGMARNADYEQLWMCVERDGDYYVEYFADRPLYPRREDFITEDEELDYARYRNQLYEKQKQYIHVDSCISYYGDQIGLDAGATLTPSATTGASVTFTASASVFASNMVGRRLVRKSVTGDETGKAQITAYTSATVVTCEVLEDFNATTAIPAGEWFLTAGELVGADHLEGREVTIVTDGGQHPEATVSDGVVTLTRQASVVHVGLPYTGYLVTNDLEGGGTNGTSQTKKKNVHAVGVRFLDTLYAEYGTSYYKLNTIEMRTAAMKMDRPPELFTGDVKEIYANEVSGDREGGWKRDKQVIISQKNPFPCNVQLVIPYMSVSN